MSDSDSSASLDSNGIVKCSTPAKSKIKYIDKNIKIDSDDKSDDDESEDDFENDMANSSRSASPKRDVVEFNQYYYDKSDDEDEKHRTEIAHSQQITLKIQYCCWTIRGFSSCKLNKEGYINSKIFTAGVTNEFQWYFRIERFTQDTEVFYGVYVRVLTHSESEAQAEFRGYITELKGHSYRLASSIKFPRKEGYKFLGYLRKSHIRDDDYWYYRMIPEDDLTLSFRVHVQFKKYTDQLVEDFKELWKNKKFADYHFVVKGVQFPVHKAILAARSPVFAEMFEKNGDNSEVEITDIDPEAMEELLRFIYTGKVKKLIKHLKEFAVAANKYRLMDLKSICEKAMESY